MMNYLSYINCLISLVVQSQPNLTFKYCTGSTICATNADTMLQKITLVKFYIFRHVLIAWFESHILYSLREESSTVARGGYVNFGHEL